MKLRTKSVERRTGKAAELILRHAQDDGGEKAAKAEVAENCSALFKDGARLILRQAQDDESLNAEISVRSRQFVKADPSTALSTSSSSAQDDRGGKKAAKAEVAENCSALFKDGARLILRQAQDDESLNAEISVRSRQFVKADPSTSSG